MKTEINIIKNCPSCEGELTRVKDQLYCYNRNCPAKNSKVVENYSKVLKIRGLGPKTIEKLKLSRAYEIYSLSMAYIVEVLGEALGKKLYTEIERVRELSVSTFIQAVSIPLVGKAIASKLESATTDLSSWTYDYIRSFGVTDKAARNIVSWLDSKEYLLYPIKLTNSTKKDQPSSGITVCITGKLRDFKNRTEASNYLENNLGVATVSSVTKKVTYLIHEDGSNSTKVNKAREYNIPSITIKQLEEKINNE